jgi:acylphosphatase
MRPYRAVDEEKIARRYYVSGVVQGVGYRYFALRTARGLGVAGYARNLSDGRVEVYAVGPDASHATLRAELRRGPSAAEVSIVIEEEAEIEPKHAQGFEIEYDA